MEPGYWKSGKETVLLELLLSFIQFSIIFRSITCLSLNARHQLLSILRSSNETFFGKVKILKIISSFEMGPHLQAEEGRWVGIQTFEANEPSPTRQMVMEIRGGGWQPLEASLSGKVRDLEKWMGSIVLIVTLEIFGEVSLRQGIYLQLISDSMRDPGIRTSHRIYGLVSNPW